MAAAPKYDLSSVVAAARARSLRVGSRVIERAKPLFVGCSNTEVVERICDVIASLTADDFAKTVLMDYATPVEADVYAIDLDGNGVYIKFYVSNGTVVTSCHQLESTIRTAIGKRITP